MNELERVREQIIERLYANGYRPWDGCKALANEILCTKGIRIECDVQSLPVAKGLYLDGHSDDKYITQDAKATHISQQTQQDMLKPDSEGNHWVKVIPKENKE